MPGFDGSCQLVGASDVAIVGGETASPGEYTFDAYILGSVPWIISFRFCCWGGCNIEYWDGMFQVGVGGISLFWFCWFMIMTPPPPPPKPIALDWAVDTFGGTIRCPAMKVKISYFTHFQGIKINAIVFYNGQWWLKNSIYLRMARHGYCCVFLFGYLVVDFCFLLSKHQPYTKNQQAHLLTYQMAYIDTFVPWNTKFVQVLT